MTIMIVDLPPKTLGLLFYLLDGYFTNLAIGHLQDTEAGPGTDTLAETFWAVVTEVQTGDSAPYDELIVLAERVLEAKASAGKDQPS